MDARECARNRRASFPFYRSFMHPSAFVKPRALVIDQVNAGTITVVARRTLGVGVREFSTPEDLVMDLRPGQDAFIFCDVNKVPLFVDLLGAVREVDPRIPFFYLSSVVHPKAVEQSQKNGASGWIVRPFDYPWLVGTVWRHFDCWRREEGAPFSMNPTARSQVERDRTAQERRSAESLSVPVVLNICRPDIRRTVQSCLSGALSPFGLDPRWLNDSADGTAPHVSFLRTAALVVTHPLFAARPRQKPIADVLEDYRDHIKQLRQETRGVICALVGDLPALATLETIHGAGADYVLHLPIQWRHLAPIAGDALDRWLS